MLVELHVSVEDEPVEVEKMSGYSFCVSLEYSPENIKKAYAANNSKF